MAIQALKTPYCFFELERTQLANLLGMSVQNPQLAGYLSTGNRCNFLNVQGSTACL